MKCAIPLIIVSLLLHSGCDDDGEVKNDGFYPINVSSDYYLSDIAFIDDSNGIICGSPRLFAKTQDGAKTWVISDVPGIGVSAFMIDNQTFFASGVGVYGSTDGGQSFIELGNSSNWGATTFDMHFFDQNTGVIIKSGRIYKTTDGGDTWAEKYAEGSFCSILEFTSPAIGYLAGGASFDSTSAGEIHKTIDGGETWFEILSSPSEVLAISFLNDTIGFYANYDDELYKTIDGGMIWNKIAVIDGYNREILFINEMMGYVINNTSILKTLDGGINWILEYKTTPHPEYGEIPLTEIIKTQNHIYAIGDYGTILKKDL